MLTPKQLEKFKKEFLRKLAEIDKKIDSLEDIKLLDSVLYNKIKPGADLLRQNLELHLDSFFDKINKNQFHDGYGEFQIKCYETIDGTRQTFKDYPSFWYEIYPSIRAILGLISILTILPVLAITNAIGVSGFNALFFKKPKQDPNEILQDIEHYIYGKNNDSLGEKCFIGEIAYANEEKTPQVSL